jgi:hypothetical protein
MARTTKTPHKVSRNKSGTPIVRASKQFSGRPKRTTREPFSIQSSRRGFSRRRGVERISLDLRTRTPRLSAEGSLDRKIAAQPHRASRR